MCWNEKVSWITFIIGTILSVILFTIGVKRKNVMIKAAACLWEIVLLMQFFEALIHRDNGKCNKLGKIATQGAFWANILQPLAVIAVFWAFNSSLQIGIAQVTTLLLLVAYLELYIYYYLNRKFTCLKKSDCNHLEYYWWNWRGILTVLYMILIAGGIWFFGRSTHSDNMFKIFLLAFIYGALLLTVIFYKNSIRKRG